MKNAKESKSKTQKICDMFRNIDVFGRQISMSYKGNEYFFYFNCNSLYKTHIGATITLLLHIVALTYIAYQFIVFIRKISI